MASGTISRYPVIKTYSGSGNTGAWGNLSIPTDVVSLSTGAVLSVTCDGNYRAVIFSNESSGTHALRVFDFTTTNMNSVTNKDITYSIKYFLF